MLKFIHMEHKKYLTPSKVVTVAESYCPSPHSLSHGVHAGSTFLQFDLQNKPANQTESIRKICYFVLKQYYNIVYYRYISYQTNVMPLLLIVAQKNKCIGYFKNSTNIYCYRYSTYTSRIHFLTSPHALLGGSLGNLSYTSQATFSMNHLKSLHLCSSLNCICLLMSPTGYPLTLGSRVQKYSRCSLSNQTSTTRM